jgi:signal transduction histidine kinase/DNA-binding response OmpR family regulator
MGFVFHPAIALTSRLRYAQKFTLLGLLVLVAIGSLQFSLYRALDRVIEPSRQELEGIDEMMQLHRCIQLIQQHRGLSAGLLGGNTSLQDKRADKAREAQEAVQRLLQKLPERIVASAAWREFYTDWEVLRQDGLTWPVARSLIAHEQLISKALALAPEITDASALTLDPDLNSYYLVAALVDLPRFTEQLGQTRAYGAAILSQKKADAAQKTHMAELLGRVAIAHASFQGTLGKVAAYNPSLESRLITSSRPIENEMLGVMAQVRSEIIAGHYGIDSAAYIDRMTALIDQGFAVGEEILAPALRQLVQARLNAATDSLRLNVAVSGVLALAFGYLVIGTFLALTQQIQRSRDRLRTMVDDSADRALLVESIAAGDLSKDLRDSEEAPPAETPRAIASRDEVGELWSALDQMSRLQHRLGRGFVKMTRTLRQHRDAERTQDWFKSGVNAVDMHLRGDRTLAQLTQAVVRELATRVGGAVAVMYLTDEDEPSLHDELKLAASYACSGERVARTRLGLGEGLAGEAARTKKTRVLSDLPSGYLPIASALGETSPVSVVAVPLVHDDALKGLVEIGSLHPFEPQQIEWLEHVAESIAISIDVLQARQRVNELLEQTQAQTEELRVQQEQMQESNRELEERTQLLEQQRETIAAKNREVEAGNQQLARKAQELERISTYKSEFLANMSHELRTPLNSMLILSSLLQQNRQGRLTDKEVEYATTIHGAGKDLLNLINDILDLSKIEAGKLELRVDEVDVAELVDELARLFKPMADDRHIEFGTRVAEGTPASLRADGVRLRQVLKNLLSNAIKFTAQGRVALAIEPGWIGNGAQRQAALDFVVSDTGIGVPEDKHEQIFQAFQQADGSTSRRFGGTGLGLSISRQLAHHMGGDISLNSVAGQGSVFTLRIPLRQSPGERLTNEILVAPPLVKPPSSDDTALREPARGDLPVAAIEDDRDKVAPDRRTILVIEDDRAFAGILRDAVRERGFDAIVAIDGESGIELADRLVPDAIILDVMLPRIDGWGVMRSIKGNLRTRHIPVHFVTCLEDRQRALGMGAIGFVSKPAGIEQLERVFRAISDAIDKGDKRLLLVEDDEAEATAVTELLKTPGLEIVHACSAPEALERLARERFDCIVLDLNLGLDLGGMSGFDLLDELKRSEAGVATPVIVHSGRELSAVEERRLLPYTESVVIKGAESPERLLNEVTLFLHLVESALPPAKRKLIQLALDKEAMFEERTVLLVDDDMRNIFSLSGALAGKGMRIVEATNGQEALEQLEQHPEVDIVLMDIMMPRMDGLEAMRRIRRHGAHARLPIIALTAKAMAGDQRACLDAGANDYIAKPVDLDKLFSLMRVWLCQAR